MGLGLQGAFGVDALQQLLRQRHAERLQQMLQEQARQDKLAQQSQENQFRTRSLDIQERALEPKLNPPEKPMILGEGQSLVEPGTGRIIAGIPKPQAPERPFSIAPGGNLVSPQGGVLFTAPQKPDKPEKERLVQVMGPGGTPIWVRESDAVNKPAANVPRQPTGADRTALGFFNRMVEAERNARKVEDKLGGRDLGAQQYAPGWLENWIQSPEGQAYTQAQRMYTEARLRKESGAAIPPSEFETDRKTNFRIAGDSPDIVKQKRASRLTTMRGLGNTAGRAFQEYYGEGTTLDDLLKEFGDEAPEQKPIPGIPGGIAELRNGKWIRVK